jgi:hypothetical protein
VHITPSLVFSDVTYVDSFHDTYQFFESDDVAAFVNHHKQYDIKARYEFYQQDYTDTLPLTPTSYDLIISQYA